MRLPFQWSKGLSSHFVSLLTGTLIFATLLSAAPTSVTPAEDLTTAGRKLFSRACPSINDLVPYLQAKGLGPNTVFYTKPAINRDGLHFTTTLNPSGQCYATLVTEQWVLDKISQCGVGPEQDKLVPRISAALATGATGTAYILIQKGADINAPGKIWGQVEFPTLQRNTNIQKIVRVNYQDFNDQETVWSAGDPFTGPPPSVP